MLSNTKQTPSSPDQKLIQMKIDETLLKRQSFNYNHSISCVTNLKWRIRCPNKTINSPYLLHLGCYYYVSSGIFFIYLFLSMWIVIRHATSITFDKILHTQFKMFRKETRFAMHVISIYVLNRPTGKQEWQIRTSKDS